MISDFLLERYRLGELPPGEVERIRSLLERHDDLRARAADLDRSDREIRRTAFSQRLAAALIDRALIERTPPVRWALVAATATAVAVVVVLRPAIITRGDRFVDERGTRIKGGPTLIVYRKTASGSELLQDGAAVRAADLIRIGYRVDAPGYGTIVSLDSRGMTTVHLPDRGTQAVALKAGAVVLLDNAFELDDAPAVERFYFVTSARVFDLAPVIDALWKGSPLPGSTAASTFSLRKDIRP